MGWKKDILKAIEAQQEAIDRLLDKATAENIPVDAEMDFATNKVIAQRNRLEAVLKSADLFKSVKDGDSKPTKDDPIVDYAWMYKIYPNANLPTRYYYEIQDLMTQVINNLAIYSDDLEQDEEIKKCMREALLFDDAYMFKENDKWYACRASKKGDKYAVSKIIWYGFNKETIDLDGKRKEEKFKDVEYKYTIGKDLLEIKCFYDRIGLYVKLIPYLETWIVYMLCKQKSAGNLALIADSSELGGQSMGFLRKPEVVEIKDRTFDNQSNYNVSLEEKIRWYQPKPEVDKLFQTLDSQMDIVHQYIYERCGLSVKAADEIQTLAAEAEVAMDAAKRFYKYLINSFLILKEKGVNVKIGFNEDVKEATDEAFNDAENGDNPEMKRDGNHNARDEKAGGLRSVKGGSK